MNRPKAMKTVEPPPSPVKPSSPCEYHGAEVFLFRKHQCSYMHRFHKNSFKHRSLPWLTAVLGGILGFLAPIFHHTVHGLIFLRSTSSRKKVESISVSRVSIDDDF